MLLSLPAYTRSDAHRDYNETELMGQQRAAYRDWSTPSLSALTDCFLAALPHAAPCLVEELWSVRR